MKWKQYKTSLIKNLSSLTDEKRLVFAINICERLLPEYKLFYEKHNWGSYTKMHSFLNLIYECSRVGNYDTKNIEAAIIEIELLIPDIDDFSDLSSSFALNTGIAILETMKFIIDKRESRIFEIGNCMYDTLEYKIQDEFQDLKDKEIENHPIILGEIEYQLSITKSFR